MLNFENHCVRLRQRAENFGPQVTSPARSARAAPRGGMPLRAENSSKLATHFSHSPRDDFLRALKSLVSHYTCTELSMMVVPSTPRSCSATLLLLFLAPGRLCCPAGGCAWVRSVLEWTSRDFLQKSCASGSGEPLGARRPLQIIVFAAI